MKRSVQKTAYYFNGKQQHLALIAKGVRFPAGQWIWVADESLTLFPRMKDATFRFSALLTDFDVDQLEQQLEREETDA